MAMRILVDISHPAHVHFYHHIIEALLQRGHEIRIVARHKDVTRRLLDAFGLDYVSVGSADRKNRLQQLGELLWRDFLLWKIIRRWKADLVLTRNPSGVQAAWLAGIPGIFDTDDGRAAGLHCRIAVPFAHTITSPACLTSDFGAKHLRYQGLKQSAYLHPLHFKPDPSVMERYGLSPDEGFFIVRFVDMTAAHDSGESGMPEKARRRLLQILSAHGPTFVNQEGVGTQGVDGKGWPFSAEDIHHLLAYARLFVGDSQTMAAEAAMLGTPVLRMSSFARRLDYLNLLEDQYHLVRSFQPDETTEFFSELERQLNSPDRSIERASSLSSLMADSEDVTDWYANFVESFEQLSRARR